MQLFCDRLLNIRKVLPVVEDVAFALPLNPACECIVTSSLCL